MADINVALSWSIAAVLLTAATGKTAGRPTLPDWLIVAGETLLALLLISRYLPLFVDAVALVTCVVYLVHAMSRPSNDKCACFGTRMPRSGKTAQIVRNAALVVVAVGLLGTAALNPSSRSLLPAASAIAGLGLGAILVAGPWLGEWAVGSPRATDRLA